MNDNCSGCPSITNLKKPGANQREYFYPYYSRPVWHVAGRKAGSDTDSVLFLGTILRNDPMAKQRTGTKDKQAHYPRATAGSAAMARCTPLAELLSLLFDDTMEKGYVCVGDLRGSSTITCEASSSKTDTESCPTGLFSSIARK